MMRKYFLSFFAAFLISFLLVILCNFFSKGDGGNDLCESLYGVYTGTLPCADCEGIDVILTFRKDSSFTRVLKYLGKNDYLFTEEGVFEWDDEYRIVTVAGNDRQMYGLGKGVLYYLDEEGKRIKGDLASMYILEKNIQDSVLEDKIWRLKEMNGAKLNHESMGEDAFLIFHSETLSFSGRNTCNKIFGRYKLKKPGVIEISKVSATRMKCDNASYEQEFMALFSNIVSYFFPEEGVLCFHNREGDIIAQFALQEHK